MLEDKPQRKWPEFLRPNRGWFIAAAGMIAAYIIERFDAPLWLALAVLVLLLVAAGIHPWVVKNKARHIAFWCVLLVCAGGVVAKVRVESSQPEPLGKQPAISIMGRTNDLSSMRIWVANSGKESIKLTGCGVATPSTGGMYLLKDQSSVEDYIWGQFVDAHPRRESYGTVPAKGGVNLNFLGKKIGDDDLKKGKWFREYFVGILEYSDVNGDHQIEQCSYMDMEQRKAMACQTHNNHAPPRAICN